MVFQNSKFSPLKIACKKFRKHKFLHAIFNGKNSAFLKTVFIIRFLRLWRIFMVRVIKFSGISKQIFTVPYGSQTFGAEDSALKNGFDKHSFENRRQIRLYSEYFSGFWLRLQILVLRQSYYLNIFYKHSSRISILSRNEVSWGHLPEHVVSRYYIV